MKLYGRSRNVECEILEIESILYSYIVLLRVVGTSSNALYLGHGDSWSYSNYNRILVWTHALVLDKSAPV